MTKRVLLKVSGETFGGADKAIETARVDNFALELKEAHSGGADIAVVVGGGNIVRGSTYSTGDENRVRCDYMGMLGTIINALALKNSLERLKVGCEVMTPFQLEQVCEFFTRRKALEYLDRGMMLILAGGTGNPFFTTDTAAALRASQIDADILIKGTKVDGVYDSDPLKDSKARRMDSLSYTDVLRDNLRVMDSMAVALCRENSIPIFVFNIMEKGNLKKALYGQVKGTMVK